MCAFSKESPMLGFSFSLVVSGGAERDEASMFVDGAMDGDGRVDGRGRGSGRKMDAK